MGGFSSFTKREWGTLVAIGSVNFAAAICVSLQAPFYPAEAESKGATATEYGFVFGIFELTAFVSSPMFGKYMDSIGANFLLISGVFIAAASSILFGLLDYVNEHDAFIGLSFAVRIVEALGASAALTASFSIIATVFPNSVATTFASLEVLYGLGYTLGPTVGGVLYMAGGYKLPFMVLGGIMLMDAFFIVFMLPTIDDGQNKNRPQAQIWSFLKLPAVFLDSMAVTAAAVGTGYYSATLEPHLRQFGLTPVTTGFMFIISGGMYAITAPLVGRLCDTRVYPKKVIVFGCFMVIGSFLLVGPAPYTPLPSTLWMCCVGLVLHGIGNSCLLVPAFIDAIRSATANGLPDDITTYGVVSGLWASSFAFGAFFGPSVAGVLYDWVGFQKGTLFVIAVHSCLIVAMTTFICLERRPSRSPPPITEKTVINLTACWKAQDFSPQINTTVGNGNGIRHYSTFEPVSVC